MHRRSISSDLPLSARGKGTKNYCCYFVGVTLMIGGAATFIAVALFTQERNTSTDSQQNEIMESTTAISVHSSLSNLSQTDPDLYVYTMKRRIWIKSTYIPNAGMFLIQESHLNKSQSQEFCRRNRMELVRIMSVEQYLDIENYARVWLYQKFLEQGLGGHNVVLWTNMSLSNEFQDLKAFQEERFTVLDPDGNIGYSKWCPGSPISLLEHPENEHILLKLSSNPDDKQQGIINYAEDSTALCICQKLPVA